MQQTSVNNATSVDETIELEKDIQIAISVTFYNQSTNEGIENEIETLVDPDMMKINMATTYEGDLILHWGVFRGNKINDWYAPNDDIFPPNTKSYDQKAVETEFVIIDPDEKNDQKKKCITFTISKGADTIPIGGIKYVIHDLTSDKWYNNGGKDYSVSFPKTTTKDTDFTIPEWVDDVINCEANYGSWCLMHRYQKCGGIVNSVDMRNSDNLIWIYIWLRCSSQRLLDWQRNFNTPPKDLQWSMHWVTIEMTKKYAELSPNEETFNNFKFSSTALLRYSLTLVGKGTGHGQRIRDEILNIFHKFLISEKDNNFYEQWHQKLHNNTTPDDVVICEAVINFLRSGRIEDFHNTLAAGGVTKQRLESFDRKITNEPYFQPAYLWDFENFLATLKQVHSSTDLVVMYDSAQYALWNKSQFEEIVRMKDDWDTLKQIWRVTDGREALEKMIQGSLNDPGKLRDLLFFDVSLEIYLRQLVERIIHLQLDFGLYITEATAILKNIFISHPCSNEIRICYEDWIYIVEGLKNDKSVTAILKIKSVCDRVSRMLSHVIDYFNTRFDPSAKHFLNGCKINKYYVNIFTEEVIRGSVFFALSAVLKKIEPILRVKANLGPWLIISRGKGISTSGRIKYVKTLNEVQMEFFKEKTLLLTEVVGGNEEVPGNCTGLIIVKSSNYPDILAHVSVRARNLNVPLLVCFDETICNHLLKNYVDQNGELKIVNQNVEVTAIQDSEIVIDASAPQKEASEKEMMSQSVKIPEGFPNIYLELSEFTKDYVGAKANNTLKVFGNLPNWIKYPESFAIPFNVNEYFLGLDENKTIKEELLKLQQSIKAVKGSKKIVTAILEKCRNLVKGIQFVSNEDTEKLKKRLLDFGIEENNFNEAFKAIKSVWASKYNERAYISTQKVGIELEDIRMAVLVQKIIPAEYAFVIHTKNPSTNDAEEIYAEMVYGMGETLVGSYEGQSFSFTMNKNSKKWEVKSYPNKSFALQNEGFIFRSDSNTEDLQGFAGAGLFDSVPMVEHKEVMMGYHMNSLIKDSKFVEKMVTAIGNLGMEVENLYNYPQDIEGVYSANQFYIVQTRPQV